MVTQLCKSAVLLLLVPAVAVAQETDVRQKVINARRAKGRRRLSV